MEVSGMLGTSGCEEWHHGAFSVSLLSPIHPTRDNTDAFRFDLPTGIDQKKKSWKNTFTPAKSPGKGWFNNRKPFWQYIPYSNRNISALPALLLSQRQLVFHPTIPCPVEADGSVLISCPSAGPHLPLSGRFPLPLPCWHEGVSRAEQEAHALSQSPSSIVSAGAWLVRELSLHLHLSTGRLNEAVLAGSSKSAL